MQIIKGKIPCAKKVVIYGPEGIGKSTFASKFPEALFSDTEGSTSELDAARLPKPTSWAMLLEQIEYVKNTPGICKTYIVDTIDWAEAMCVESVCARYQKKGIEDFGYGNGYVYTKEELGRFLNKLQELVDRGIHVVLTAHSQIRKFEQPDEMGAYDRYELKLGKKTSSQTSPLVKEWADMVLFANYKTFSIATDDKGKKHKAQGGQRVMYTSHHPCWDAKNRYDLPEEVPFSYESIRHIIEPASVSQEPVMEKPAAEITSASVEPVMEKPAAEITSASVEPVMEKPAAEKSPIIEAPVMEQLEMETFSVSQEPVMEKPAAEISRDKAWREGVPQALLDLMDQENVDEWEVQNVVAEKGYYPANTPIANYDPGFISGVLVGAWKQVFAVILQYRNNMEVPFN